MSDPLSLHPFDAALQLQPVGENQFALDTDPTFWNMAGPFGGWLLAAGLKAVLSHPAARGSPVEAHARFFAAPKMGQLRLSLDRQSEGRSVGFWKVSFWQVQASGERLCVEVSVLLAEARATLEVVGVQMPNAPPPETLRSANLAQARLSWIRQYEFRYVHGKPFRPQPQPEGGPNLGSLLWVAHAESRQLDWPALAAFADVVAPRPFLLQSGPSPVATVALSIYFHAHGGTLGDAGRWLLLNIRGHAIRAGFFDHAVELWAEDGTLLASSTQLAWFSAT